MILNNNNINTTTETTKTKTKTAATLRSSSLSSSSKARTTGLNATVGNLFIVVVIVCITLTIVELRGFNNNANQNNPYHRDIDNCLSQPTTKSYATTTRNSRSLKNVNFEHHHDDDYYDDEDGKKRRRPILLKQKIATNSSSDLAIIVLSRRDAFDTRQVIRETWASQQNNVYFVLGQGCTIPLKLRHNGTCDILDEVLPSDYKNLTQIQINIENEIDNKLYEEQIKHNDLILGRNYIDVYKTLPEKLKSGYTFIYKHLPQTINWILKVDDDFYVRVKEFQHYLKTNYGNKQNINPSIQPLVIGGSIPYHGHHAFTNGKWKEVSQFPIGGEYPPFPLGSRGHVVSRPIFEYIVKNQKLLFNYQGEDNSLGIWLKDDFNTTLIMKEARRAMVGNGDCLKSKNNNILNLVVGHNLKAHELIWCHRNKNNALTVNQRMELQVNKYDTIKQIINEMKNMKQKSNS